MFHYFIAEQKTLKWLFYYTLMMNFLSPPNLHCIQWTFDSISDPKRSWPSSRCCYSKPCKQLVRQEESCAKKGLRESWRPKVSNFSTIGTRKLKFSSRSSVLLHNTLCLHRLCIDIFILPNFNSHISKNKALKAFCGINSWWKNYSTVSWVLYAA